MSGVAGAALRATPQALQNMQKQKPEGESKYA